jgi:hypothetical protein
MARQQFLQGTFRLPKRCMRPQPRTIPCRHRLMPDLIRFCLEDISPDRFCSPTNSFSQLAGTADPTVTSKTNTVPLRFWRRSALIQCRPNHNSGFVTLREGQPRLPRRLKSSPCAKISCPTLAASGWDKPACSSCYTS